MNTSSLAPVLISPVARRMNGFQRGKSSKSVISSHTRLAEELISISLESCFENANENHHSVNAGVTNITLACAQDCSAPALCWS